ncbi:hypothetical protein E2C01_026092 [Portunus trituberculatus]|uniref:Uncharacterized protein n=1 Tax=Portunus trituberculatus TaxID=210409 RepID=A0A5B7EH91_PORTR|nr:hypothetical protein [Portunus trituberculatus]
MASCSGLLIRCSDFGRISETTSTIAVPLCHPDYDEQAQPRVPYLPPDPCGPQRPQDRLTANTYCTTLLSRVINTAGISRPL